MKKRVISLLLILIFVVGLVPFEAHADSYNGMGPRVMEGGQRDFKWPVPSYYNISSCFLDPDATGERNGHYHYAIDIYTGSAVPVVAAYDGEIVLAQDRGDGFGYSIVIKHNYKLSTGGTMVLYSRYSHLSQIIMSSGTVSKGQTIAKTGGTGGNYAVHLDFQILRNAWNNYTQNSIDPYANDLLELPSNVYKGGTTSCCDRYIAAIKAQYSSSPTPHTSHDKGTYMYYEAAHPHHNCYKCSVCGTIWADTNSSNYVDSCDQCVKPEKPAITGLGSLYLPQETITIQWSYGANTTHCNYWLYKKEGGNWTNINRIDYATSPVTEKLDAGDYRVLIVATNSNASGWPWTDSDFAYFSVGETRGTKVSFEPQGGSFGSAVLSCPINGINRARGSGETILYTNTPDTNSYGKEMSVDSYGRVQAIRGYGNTEQMSVPSGGFVLSAHSANNNPGMTLIEQASTDDYVGYDLSTGMVYNYGTDDSAYLANHLYMTSDYNYGSLPVPARKGYLFDGWYDSASGGNRINNGTALTTYTLYAHWTPVQSASPAATTELNGNRYELFDYNMSWNEAKAFCEARGGHLVTITDSTEQREVLKLIKKGNNSLYFLGCSDVEKEGTWKWVTGEAFSYENWDKHGPEPSNSDGENYAMMLNRDYGANKHTGEWVDGKDKEPVVWFYSYSNTGFVCEYDADIKINFDLQGGSYPTQQDRDLANSKKVLQNSTYGNLPVPVKEGYIFGGWGLNSTTGDRVYEDTKFSSSTLVAKWLSPSEAYWSQQNKYNGHTYERYEYNLTWKEAEEFCEARGGYLAVITSKEELNTVSSMATNGQSYIYWIGCSDEQTEGQWTWVNGEEFSYTNWDPQYPEPDTADGYDFGGIVNKTIAPNKQHGEWLSNYNRPNDTSGKYWLSNYGFICEYDTIPHVHTLTAVAKVPASCTTNGAEAYWKCSGCGKMFSDAQGKNEISAPVVIKATGHEWDGGKVTEAATCTEAGVRTFTCKHDSSHTRTEAIPALGHNYKAVVTAPTCTEKGYSTHTCTRCGDSYVDSYVNALGHSWDSGRVTKEPTETSEGVKTFTCTVCGATRTESIPKQTHTHNYTDVVTSPTCIEQGYTTHTCAGCGESYVDSYVDALGHKTELRNAKAATCTADGYTGDEICSTCGETIRKGTVIKAAGHKWDSGKVTEEPTETAEGVKTFTCTVCGETRTESIPKLTPSTPTNPFVDVKQGEYYYEPVLWAVNHQPQITNGTSATTFSPDATCTRGQVVTFLWRANGCPEPKSTSNPFTDVASDAYYYKAVLWAVENGITNGTSATTFSPEDPCTRAHVVTFLWRSANKPAAGSTNPFHDVAAGQYYTDAVLWAVSKNITNGTSATTFSPDNPCTRGQIVTFLYRYIGKTS